MDAIRLVIIRHGHVEGIDPPRFRGHADLALTPDGVTQAQGIAKRIAGEWKPSAMYTSPLRRCLQTSEPIAEACGLTALSLGDLVDCDYGEWTGKTYEEAQAADAELFDLWFAQPQLVRFPNGDALQDVVARSADALRLALEKYRGQTILFVTHDSVIRCLLLQLLDMPLSAYWHIAQDPCGLNEVTIAGSTICVQRVNEHGQR